MFRPASRRWRARCPTGPAGCTRSGTTAFGLSSAAMATRSGCSRVAAMSGPTGRPGSLRPRARSGRSRSPSTARLWFAGLSEHIESGYGQAMFEAACTMGLEGIVSKRRDSPYRFGRSPDWVKVRESKCAGGDAAAGIDEDHPLKPRCGRRPAANTPQAGAAPSRFNWSSGNSCMERCPLGMGPTILVHIHGPVPSVSGEGHSCPGRATRAGKFTRTHAGHADPPNRGLWCVHPTMEARCWWRNEHRPSRISVWLRSLDATCKCCERSWRFHEKDRT